MQGKLYKYIADDHRRLEELLNRSTASPGSIDDALYGRCRAGLLKHISVKFVRSWRAVNSNQS